MKCLLAFAGFLLAGLALATHPFVPGKQYEYKYQGCAASGLIGLPPQYAGLCMKARIALSPKDPEVIVVQIKEPKIGMLNEKLRSEEAFYREELPIQYSPLSQYSRELQEPFLITMRSGLVVSLDVPEAEPTIIKNIKRSVASLVQMNINGVEKVPQKVELLLPKSEENSKKLSFSVMEESMMGVCETLYSISPMPEYLAQAEEKEIPLQLREISPEGHMIVTKVINMENCIKKSSFHHISPVSSDCSFPEAVCKAKLSTSSYTRYLIEGKRNSYLLKGVWNQGHLIVRPAEADVKTMTYQTMFLKSVVSHQPPTVPSGRKIGLVYDLLTLTPGMKTLESEELVKKPVFPIQSVLDKQVPVEQVISKIEVLLKEVSQKVEQYTKVKETVLPMRLLEIVKGIQMLKYEDLKRLSQKIMSGQLSEHHDWYSHVQISSLNKETEKEIFLDCLAYSGTNPSILVIKDLISEKLLKGERAVQVLMTIPMTLSLPVPQIIKTLAEITQLAPVKEHRQMYTTSILSLTNIAYHTCIDLNISRSSYPVHYLNGEICKPNHEVVVNVILPLLKEGLYSAHSHHEKELFLRALGNLAHPQVLPILKKYALGSQQMKDVQLRTMAIFSLDRCAKLYPKQVLDIMMPIVTNVMDHYEPRIAAITMILETKPSAVLLQQIALQTWYEPSIQLKSFIYSTFKTLSNSTFPTYNDTVMAMKAAMALRLTKPVAEGAHYSHNVYLTKYVPEHFLASKLDLFHIGSVDSLIPRRLYSKLSSIINGYEYTPLKVSLFNQGTQTLLNKLLFPEVAKKSGTKIPFDFWSSSNILEKIKTDIKQSDVPRGRLHFKLYDKIERIISYDETLEFIKEILHEDMLKLEKLEGVKELNLQRLMPLREVLMTIPTELGFPVVVTARMPLFMSLRGSIKSQFEPKQLKPSTLLKNEPPLKMEVTADIKPLVSLQRIVKCTIVTPFLEEHPVAGYEQLMQYALPGKLYFKLDTREKIIHTEFTPIEVPEVAIMHEHVRPFTTIYKPLELKPVIESQNFKVIDKQVKPIEKSYVFGKKLLGLDLEFNVKTEESVYAFSSFYHKLRHYNPLTLLNFYYALPSPICNKKVTLLWKPQSSETKSIKMISHYATVPVDIEHLTSERYNRHDRKDYNMEEEHYNRHDYFEELYKKHDRQDYDTEELYGKYDYPPSHIYPKNIYPQIPKVDIPLMKKILSIKPPTDLKISPKLKQVYYKNTYAHMVKTEFRLTGQQERIYRAQLTMVNTTEPQYYARKTSLLLELVKVPEMTPFKIDVVTELQMPVLKFKKLEDLIQLRPEVKLWTEVILPEGHKIKIGALLLRNNKQKEFIEYSPEKKRCLENEAQGMAISYNCTMAYLQATVLNEMDIEILNERGQITPKYYKMFYALDTFFKYLLYPHMETDPFKKSEKQNAVEIKIKREPFKQLWDLEIKKPYEVTYFYNLIESNPIRYLLPFNALISPVRDTTNYIFNGNFYPTCFVMKHYLKTYDNLTIPLKPSSPNCWHLLMKDCSEESKLGVYLKPVEQGKEVKVILGETEVRIVPSQPLPKLFIDKQEYHLNEENIQKKPIYVMKDNYVVLKVVVLPELLVKLESPAFKFVMYHDGENVWLQPSNVYRGRCCGLCGDFNGEKYADLKTPEMCALNTTKVQQYYNSWIVPEESCHPVPVPKYQCHPFQYIPTGEFAEMKLLSRSMYTTETYEMRPMELPSRRGYKCYSLKPVKVCKPGFEPKYLRQEKIDFYCALEGVYVPPERRQVDLSEYKEVPEQCVLRH